MTDRIHECLDGERPPTDLSEEERRELEELQELVRESLAFVRDAPAPDLERAVLEEIRRTDLAESGAGSPGRSLPRALGEVLSWLWTPRPVRIRPAWGLAAVLVLALGIGGLPLRTGAPGAGAGAELASSERADATIYVRFELEASGASTVRLAGTFTDWRPSYDLVETAPGRWTGLVPLRPGVHEYAFVVNGERWVADPHAPHVRDGFGGVNSRIALVAPAQYRTGGSS